MASLEKSLPETVFVHFTVPLKTNNESWKTQLKKLMGKQKLWEYADNIQRNAYNRMLLEEYQGKKPVFDLATMESALSEGTRVNFDFNGTSYYALAKEYTKDGGHLNENGSKRVAAALIDFLAKL
jgi:hypothetical protein